jgi:hypothetical protein
MVRKSNIRISSDKVPQRRNETAVSGFPNTAVAENKWD